MLTCVVLGFLAGGMLVIGVSFVSFWKSLTLRKSSAMK
jgi:CHASE3 domain sensor protein